MKYLKQLGYLVILSLFVQSCGGNSAEERAEAEVAEAREELENEMNGQAANLENAMKQAKEALEKAGMGEAGEPVNFRELKKVLPQELAGMELTDQSGQTTGAMGFNISEAEVEFSGADGQKITIKIVDTGGLAMAAMGMAAWTNVTIDKEDSNGYERTTTINGHKAYEKYNTRNQNGEISIFAAERFVVNVEGRKVSMEDLKKVLEKIDLDDLEDLS